MTPYDVAGQWRGRNWSPAELRVVGSFAKKIVAGRYRSVLSTVEDCRGALDRLRWMHRDAPWAVRPRSRVAVAQRLGALARDLGQARPATKWGEAELRVVDRFARAFVRGRYPELQMAARDCQQALERARRERTDGVRLFAARSTVAVRERLKAGVRKLKGRTSLRAWSKQELRLLDGYARALVRGKYAKARSAAADYLRDIGRLRLKYPDAAWLASRHSLGAVVQRLRDRAHMMGMPRGPAPWSREEKRLLDAYAHAVIRREYRNAGDAGRALARDMMALSGNRTGSGASRPRNTRAVRVKLWERARELGRPFLSLPWAPAEKLSAKSYARRLSLGEFRNAWDAAVLCSEDLNRLRSKHPDARWAKMRRTTLAVWARIWHAADRLGLKWTDSLWMPAEDRVVGRYARDVVLGRYPTAKAAALNCWRELDRFHRGRRKRKLKQQGQPGPRTLRAVCGRIEARVNALRKPRRANR